MHGYLLRPDDCFFKYEVGVVKLLISIHPIVIEVCKLKMNIPAASKSNKVFGEPKVPTKALKEFNGKKKSKKKAKSCLSLSLAALHLDFDDVNPVDVSACFYV